MTIKLVCFDLEGTLVLNNHGKGHGALWGTIVHALGEHAQDQEKRTDEKRARGEYANYMEWCIDCLQQYQRAGLTKQIFRRLLDDAQIREGVADTIKELHTRGIVTAIVSGGFQQQAARLQLAHGIRHSLAAVQLYWNHDGTVAGWNLLPADLQGKIDFVELLRREYRLELNECAFVGNGSNDVFIAKHVGTSFAVADAHKELKAVATFTLNNFSDLLQHI